MSATICWRPLRNDKSLNCPAPSKFQEIMQAGGLALPAILRQADRPVLHGMAVGYELNEANANPFREIVELLDKYDEIEVWAS